MDVSVVIPARLGSTRLPGKVLLDIAGKPMLQWVHEHALAMKTPDCEVWIATDSEQVATAARNWGAKVAMTPTTCASGTERIVSMLDQLKGGFIINIQGDEPFVPSDLLDRMVSELVENACDIVTPVFQLTDPADLLDPNRVKAVRAADGRALYFSRSAAPHIRGTDIAEWPSRGLHWGHIGVYAYSRSVLGNYSKLTPGVLEQGESLEQLRFLENGLTIQTLATDYHPIGVDTEDDLERARQLAARPA